jgi:hypothetical protein
LFLNIVFISFGKGRLMKKIAISILIVIVVCLSLAARSNQNVISPVQQKSIGSEILKVHEEMKKAAEN